MIIIYNLKGLLFGIAGIALGLAAFAATQSLALGLLAISAVWMFSLKRGPVDPQTGQRPRFASVFFIPMWIWAIPLLLAVLPVFVVERVVKALPADPRMALLEADEAVLRLHATGGDAALSRHVRDMLITAAVEEAKAEESRVFTRVGEEAVLVLVQLPALRQFEDSARDELLSLLNLALLTYPDAGGKSAYIGVKGRMAYGAIQTPQDGSKTAGAISKRQFLDFYDPSPASPSEQGESPDAPRL